MKAPYIVMQIPETLGSNGIIGLYGKMMNMDQASMKQGLDHQFLMVLPKPILPGDLEFLASEIILFQAWCKATFDKTPLIHAV
jgi:hypothetical protein